MLTDKANFLRISMDELVRRLRSGDATLLSVVLATPAVSALLGQKPPAEQPPRAAPDL